MATIELLLFYFILLLFIEHCTSHFEYHICTWFEMFHGHNIVNFHTKIEFVLIRKSKLIFQKSYRPGNFHNFVHRYLWISVLSKNFNQKTISFYRTKNIVSEKKKRKRWHRTMFIRSRLMISRIFFIISKYQEILMYFVMLYVLCRLLIISHKLNLHNFPQFICNFLFV